MTEQYVAHAIAQDALKNAAPSPFAQIFRHASLEVELFAPRGVDTQQPHEKDEVYFVIQGSGNFVNGDKRHTFGPGDFIFVNAGVVHRFEDFTDDLLVWVVLYGPVGGESADPV